MNLRKPRPIRTAHREEGMEEVWMLEVEEEGGSLRGTGSPRGGGKGQEAEAERRCER